MKPSYSLPRWFLLIISFYIVLALAAAPPRAVAQQKKPGRGRGAPPQRPTAPPAPRSALLTNEAWRNAPRTPTTSDEIDRLVAAELKSSNIEPAPLTTDEQFLRRLILDLTGKLPTPSEVSAFLADQDPGKRAKIIDKLLDTDDYAKHWARYWRDVIAARIQDRRGL